MYKFNICLKNDYEKKYIENYNNKEMFLKDIYNIIENEIFYKYEIKETKYYYHIYLRNTIKENYYITIKKKYYKEIEKTLKEIKINYYDIKNKKEYTLNFFMPEKI